MANKLFLKKTAHFNNIPDELVPELPAHGKRVVFQYIKPIQDPVAGKNGTPITIYPADHQFAPVSRVRNPKTSEWLAISLLSREDKEGNPIVENAERAALHWRPQERGGHLNITIGHDPVLDQLYQFLMLSQEVADNLLTDEMRDPSVIPSVKYIDYDKRAKDELAAQNLRWEAFAKANELTDSQREQLAYILGYNKSHTEEQLTAAIRSFAETNPKSFFDKIGDPKMMYKARITQAIDLNVIAVDADLKVLRWNDKFRREFMKITSTDIADIQLDYAERCEDPDFVKSIDAVIAREVKKSSSASK